MAYITGTEYYWRHWITISVNLQDNFLIFDQHTATSRRFPDVPDLPTRPEWRTDSDHSFPKHRSHEHDTICHRGTSLDTLILKTKNRFVTYFLEGRGVEGRRKFFIKLCNLNQAMRHPRIPLSISWSVSLGNSPALLNIFQYFSSFSWASRSWT